MRRLPKSLLIIGASIAGLLVVLVIAALNIVQTGWFRNFVRDKIVSAVENSTGGRTGIGNFSFSPTQLRAEVDDVVLHGTEGPNQPPLLRAKSIMVGLKIVSVLRRQVNLDLLAIDQPQVFLEVKPDGSTNLPVPKVNRTAKSDPIQTVMDLAVGRFNIRNGLLVLKDTKTPLDVQGENLQAHMVYDASIPKYAGHLSMTPVYVQKGNGPRLPVNTNVAFAIAQNRIDITSARFDAPESKVQVTASVNDLSNPQGSLHITGRLDPAELARTLGLNTAGSLRRPPPVDLALTAGLNHNTLDLVGLQISAGASGFDASGSIPDIKDMIGSVRFNGRLALGELGRILGLSARPEGTVTLAGGAKLNGTQNYDVTARIDARDVSFRSGATRISGVNAQAGVNARPNLIAANDIRLAALGGMFHGSAEVRNMDRFRFDGDLRNFDTRYLAQKYASRNVVWDGIISGPVRVAGSLKGPASRDLVATARLGIRPGPNGVPLSGLLDVAYNARRGLVNFGNSFLQLPSTRLAFSGAIGNQLNIDFTSRNLNDLLPAIAMASSNPPQNLPVKLAGGGAASFNGTVAGSLSDPRIAGHVSLTNFLANGEQFSQFGADLSAQKSGASVQKLMLTGQGIQAQANGTVGLQNWKPADFEPVNANVSVRSANVHSLLVAAGSGSTPITGSLAADAQVTGTMGDPRGNADVALVNGTAAMEPFHAIRAHVNYAGQLIQLTNAEVTMPAGRIALTAAFQHPPKQFQAGRIQFQLTSTPIKVQQFRTVQEQQPGLQGTVNLRAEGSAELVPPAPNRPRVRLTTLNADIAARGLHLGTERVGDVTLVANTAGQNLTFRLDSDLASSSIHGSGQATLAGDYPAAATIAFNPIRVGPLMRLASRGGQAQPQAWDGTVDGTLAIDGPALRPQDLKGTLQLTTVQIAGTQQAAAKVAARRPLSLRNQGPVMVTLDREVLHVQSAHFVGPSTNLSATGALSLAQPRTVDIRADGNIGLELAETFSPDMFASGNIVLAASVSGPLAQPAINGRLQLVDASLNYADAPAGLSNATGVILFNGKEAVIQSLTGESGGGKVAVTGVVRYGGPQMDFRVRATADHVRVRQSNVSAQVNAGIELVGTTTQSLLSGDVTILEVALRSHTDIGSILSQGGVPASTPTTQSGLLAGMRLDVRIDTSPAVQFLTSLTENLHADSHLQLRGTALQPGMLGRVVVTQGTIVFFGTKYTINQGTINFYNPSRIQPVLNVDLETKAQGVDVTLSVTGPIDNMKLTYHSDPPLQFSDIVYLLATGKPPTSDPVLAANQPPAPQQNLEQMGASALLSEAIANPVSGRLQRLFGVTRLKIDPQLVGGTTNTVQAKLTLEQQITRDLTFVYIQDVRQSNPQTIRIEWAIDPTWSAVAVRQENGEFGVDFFYKKRFW